MKNISSRLDHDKLHFFWCTIIFLTVIFSSTLLAGQNGTSKPSKAEVMQKTQRLQMPFIANEGQTDENVAFYANTFGGTMFVTKSGEIVYSLPTKSSKLEVQSLEVRGRNTDISNRSTERSRRSPKSEGSWVTTTVDSSGDVGYGSSIALDSSGKVHISYLSDESNNALKYATNASGSWVITTVAAYAVSRSSIALDSSGKVHICYASDGSIVYTTNASGLWVGTTVDQRSSTGFNMEPSMALDSSGRAHICYVDEFWGYLKYTTGTYGGSWVENTVDNSYDVSAYPPSIALDSSGKAHISYIINESLFSSQSLKYATNASGSWVKKTLDDSSYVVWGTSIALNSFGKVFISYYDYTHGDLKYSSNAYGSWVENIVDSSGNVGEFQSTAFDTSDKVHISYLDSSNKDLKYATNASGSWVTTTVDSSSRVDEGSSIALDSSDKVHISYYDSSYGDLKYVTNSVQTIPTPIPTPTPGSTGNISGQVIDAATGAGINGAIVELDTGESTTTYSMQGLDGVYAISWVSIGQHIITASALNYTSSSQTVTVIEGNPNPQTGANIFNINLGLISGCGEYNIMSISTTKLKIKRNTSEEIFITSAQGTKTEDDVLVIKCPVEGMSVTTKIKDGGSKLISVLPEIIETDENGEAIFTIKAKNKKGNTKVYFYITEWGDWATMQLKVKVK